MKTGLVLSGGAIRGVAHIGVIQALEEMNVKVSYISGASAGSIVGALYAYGYKPQEILGIIKSINFFKSVRLLWRGPGLLRAEGLLELMVKYMPENNFSALKIPLSVCLTDLLLNQSQYITEGELAPAVMASCAIPGVFPPLMVNDKLYVDGGVLDNLPVHPLQGKVDFIIGSHCNNLSRQFDPKNLKVVLERTMLMMVQTNTQITKGLCDVVIEPTGLGSYSGVDIAKSQEIFDFAYRFTKEKFSQKDFERANGAN